MKRTLVWMGIIVMLYGGAVSASNVLQTLTGNQDGEELLHQGSSYLLGAEYQEDAVNLPEGNVPPYEGEKIEESEEEDGEGGDSPDEDVEGLEEEDQNMPEDNEGGRV